MLALCSMDCVEKEAISATEASAGSGGSETAVGWD